MNRLQDTSSECTRIWDFSKLSFLQWIFSICTLNFFFFFNFKKALGTSLAVQWLRLHVPTTGGPDLIPRFGQGSSSYMPKRKNLNAATKTQWKAAVFLWGRTLQPEVFCFPELMGESSFLLHPTKVVTACLQHLCHGEPPCESLHLESPVPTDPQACLESKLCLCAFFLCDDLSEAWSILPVCLTGPWTELFMPLNIPCI